MNTPCMLLGLALLAQTPSPVPVNTSGQTEADVTRALYPYYAHAASTYDFVLDDRHPLELRKQPVLTWTNAEGYVGAVFVWTHAGRPEVVGCIGSRQKSPDECVVFHELHRLGSGALRPVKFGEGQRVWEPPPSAVEFRNLEGAPPPADSERRRLTQMRNLAREFTAAMKKDGDTTQLRLLPQPIFRYASPEQDVMDGALFAFVWKGTDPEVLLVLEHRRTGDQNRWQYVLARFNWQPMWVERQGKEVWRVESSGLGNTSAFISGRTEQTTLEAMQGRK